MNVGVKLHTALLHWPAKCLSSSRTNGTLGKHRTFGKSFLKALLSSFSAFYATGIRNGVLNNTDRAMVLAIDVLVGTNEYTYMSTCSK